MIFYSAVACCLGSLVVTTRFKITESWSFTSSTRQRPDNQAQKPPSLERRRFGSASLIFLTGVAFPQASSAGEIGARITKAVTQSDLGISVRRNVVRGAQVADQLDGRWEQFSDKFGLGSQRSKQSALPPKKDIPPLKPLDTMAAQKVLECTDQVFVSLTKIRKTDLQQRIMVVSEKVRPSFERSGTSLATVSNSDQGDLFNFDSYVHYKAYSDLIIERKLDFASFRPQFEKQVGQQLVEIFLASTGSDYTVATTETSSDNPKQLLTTLPRVLDRLDQLCRALVEAGFIAAIDRPILDAEQIKDWSEDLSELAWTVALDNDVSTGSQVLLQEQGFRLYPSYARCAIQWILQSYMERVQQQVTIVDYYMDTDYNSDPQKFEVKEVLLSVELESKL